MSFVGKHACRAAVSAALSFAVPSLGWTKPADLPVDIKVDFQETLPQPQRVELSADDSLAQFAAGKGFDDQSDRIKITSLNPAISGAEARPTNNAGTGASHAPPSTLFERAEQYRRQGDLKKAKVAYQELHIIAPTSAEGRTAMERLRQIENPPRSSNEFAEEQEPPPLERSSFRSEVEPRRVAPESLDDLIRAIEMLLRTQPLGVAPTSPEPQ